MFKLETFQSKLVSSPLCKGKLLYIKVGSPLGLPRSHRDKRSDSFST